MGHIDLSGRSPIVLCVFKPNHFVHVMKFRRRDMSVGKLCWSISFAVVMIGFRTSARGAFMIQLTQSGTNVIASGTGTLNLAALTSDGSTTDAGFISPAIGFLGVGPPTTSAITFYSLLTGPIAFGSGGTTNSVSGGGSEVIIAGNYEEFGVPAGYTSGAALSDSATFYGTFASLGITPGSFTWNWGTGPSADSLTVATASVPEPASLTLMCLPATFILLRRRRGISRLGKSEIRNQKSE